MTKNSAEKCDLSVVIIARNEEEMIADCIESVLMSLDTARAAGTINSSEVILSDSASTDDTINIAKRYPIKIVQLQKRWPLSASAGLYIGFLQSKGAHVYFLGGDMVLDEKWFVNAYPYLSDEKIAAVSGVEQESLDESTIIGGVIKESYKNYMPIGEVDMVGTAIFKRSVLEEVGPHNPYLKGGEDRDISYRIKSAGYKLLRIDSLSVSHYWAKKDGKLTLKRYLKSTYTWSKGDGQAMRSSIKNKDVALRHLKRYINTEFLRIYGSIFLAISFLHMNFLSFVVLQRFSYATLIINSILFSLMILYVIIRSEGGKFDEFIFSFHVIPYAIVRHIGFIRGFFIKVKDVSIYPRTPIMIKTE